MTNYKKGLVVLTLFPNSDLVTAKRRPALIAKNTAICISKTEIGVYSLLIRLKAMEIQQALLSR